MAWTKRDSVVGQLSGTDWTHQLELPARCDPYLVLADLTLFKQFTKLEPGSEGQKWLPFLIETKNGVEALQKEIKEKLGSNLLGEIRIPSVFKRSLKLSGITSKFFTARLSSDRIDKFLNLDNVVRMQLGLARISEVDTVDFPENENLESLPRRGYSPTEYVSRTYVNDADHNNDLPVLGVVDDGCNPAHPVYVNALGSRVVRIWDQSRDTSLVSKKPSYLGYGGVLTQSELSSVPISNEKAAYAKLKSAFNYAPFNKSKATHGTSVMQLLAGNVAQLPQSPCQQAVTDQASTCDVMFVQLQNHMLNDTSSGSLCVHALDAIRYIVDRAETYKPVVMANGYIKWRIIRKAVINLSYGTMTGPHDGTAMLDSAIDELVSLRGNLALVVAAGNSRSAKCHATLNIPANAHRSFGWNLAPLNPLASHLEIWIGNAQKEHVKFCLTDPHGNSTGDIGLNEIHELNDAVGNTVAWVIFLKNTALGNNGVVALVSALPTRAKAGLAGSPIAPHGLWEVCAKNIGDQAIDINAWVERNDLASARVRRQQSFLSNIGVSSVSAEATICSPASATHAVAAGAYVWASKHQSTYSGQGWGGGKTDVDVSAAVDLSASIKGIGVSAALSGSNVRMSGTSAAAPLAARYVANWMATQPHPVDITSIAAYLNALPAKRI